MREHTPTSEKIPRQLSFDEKVRALLYSHPPRVAILATIFAAEQTNLKKRELIRLFIASLFHDTGKICVDDILKMTFNDGELSPEDRAKMEAHPIYGYKFFTRLGLPKLAEIILEHHERWNGRGYPRKLKGEEISLHARILAMADALDVMIAWRPYNHLKNIDEAITEIHDESGKQFDPGLVEPFFEFVEKHRLLIRFLLLNSPRAKSKRNLGKSRRHPCQPEPCAN